MRDMERVSQPKGARYHGDIEYSEMDFHKGRMLMMAAGKYRTLLAAILESVQNAIDAEASSLWIVRDQRKKTLKITDDGNGTSSDEFGMALKQIGMTIKSADKMGRFNLGGKAFVDKCESYTFTSCPKGGTEYREWRFAGKELVKQSEKLQIPFFSHKDKFKFSPRMSKAGNKEFLPWRTQIRVNSYTTDAVIGRFDINELRDGILDNFSIDMRRLKTVVYLTDIAEDNTKTQCEVRATQYSGRPLKEEYFPRGSSMPDTIIQFYLAPRRAKGHSARIHFGEIGNSYRINERQFCASLLRVSEIFDFDNVVRQALLSGVFEGQVLTRTAKWGPDRVGFKQDDGLRQLCLHLKQWHDEVGSKILDEMREDRRGIRYQEIGVRVMRWLEDELKLPEWQHLTSFSIGNIGTGHARPKRGTVIGESDNKEISVDGGSFQQREQKNSNDKLVNDSKHKEKEGHVPITVVGPKGKKRVLVEGKSIGISLEVSEMLGESRAFRFLQERGLIEVNSRYPLFIRCDEASDLALAKYQQFIVMQALILHSQPEEFQECQRIAFDQLLKMEVSRILSGDRPLRRIRATK